MNNLIQWLIFSMVTYSTTAVAQRCGATCANAESFLGASEQTLIGSIPELKRLPRPVQGPRNSRGKWMLSDFVFATQPYTVTYFVNAAQVARIELLGTSPRIQCTKRIPFERAMVELAKTYGESKVFGAFEDDGKSTESVAFNTQDMDISLHLSVSPDDCTTRVIYKIREVKDASEL